MSKQQYDNTNTASFWANAGALENEKQPIFRGTLDVDGTPKKVSLWLNSFYSQDDADNDDIRDLVEELLGLLQDIGSRSPILKGKIEDVDATAVRDGRKSSGRRERKSRDRNVPSASREDEDGVGDAW